jgi:PAS domain S-box-containing protein
MSKILIVDDHALNRQLLAKLLGSHNHLAHEASDGAEALQLALLEQPDLIISDVLMPTMDGYEFVRRLRADPVIGQTPVIFITGNHLSREASVLAKSCGVSTTLYRPCGQEEILRSIETALEGSGHSEIVQPLKREEFDREHLQLLTDTLSEKSDQLSAVNLKLTALIELSQQLAFEHDPLKLMNEYCRAAREIVGARWNALGLLGEDKQTLQYFYTAGLNDELASRLSPKPTDKGIFGKLLKDGCAYRIRILNGDPQAEGWPPDLPPLSSCLSLPIIFQERVYGWLCLANKLGAEEFSDEDEQLALTLVAQMAAAYQNATLYNEAQHNAAELEREIAEREQAQESLRESEIRYRRLFEAARDGILILDAVTQRITDVNPFMTELLGYSRAEFMGKELWEIGLFNDKEASQDAFREVQAKVYLRYEAVPLQSKEGKPWEVEFVSNVYEEDDHQVIQCNIRDISERKRAEAAMRAKNEELSAMTQQFWQASKLATLGELAASIAHELNNPLATVSLRTESLLGQFADDDPKRKSLKIIDQEVNRMGGLVGNLLQFSRRNHPQISTIDVYKEIENTLDFVDHHLRSHQINVVREFADTLPTIYADCQQLRQVFLNLLTNASDAMTGGGTLTLRVGAGQTEDGAGAIVIEFADTGAGIKPEDLSKVWEPFFTTKGEGKGTGLGLAICRRIIEEHKGTINIESEVGRGTTVRITLSAPERE